MIKFFEKLNALPSTALAYYKAVSPNISKPYTEMSTTAQGWLNELKTYGIVRIRDQRFYEVVTRSEDFYFHKISSNSDIKNFNFQDDLFLKIIGEKNQNFHLGYQVSFKDPVYFQFLTNPDITSLLYNYYHKQPYYRNAPTIQYTHDMGATPKQAFIHRDPIRQVALSMLLNDVDESTTHMKYLLKSHKRSFSSYFNEGSLLQTNKEIIEGFEIYNCFGKKGDLFIFDQNGYHRGNFIKGTTRRLFNAVVSSDMIVKIPESMLGFTPLSSQPRYVQQMFLRNGIQTID